MPFITSLARNTIVLSWLFLGLAFVSIAVTLLSLKLRTKRIDFSDGFMLAAFIVGILLVGQTTWAIIDEGGGEHQRNLSGRKIAFVAKSLIVNEALWAFSNALIRMSACFLMRALASMTRKRIFATITASLCAIHGTISVLELSLICRPLNVQWDPDAKGACGNQTASFVAIEVLGLALDVAILLQPVLLVYNLHMHRRRKWEVILCLDAGAIVLVITGLRLRALHLANSPDFTYSKSYLGLLSTIGCMLSIVLCAVVAFRGLLLESRERKIRNLAISPASQDIYETSDNLSLDFDSILPDEPCPPYVRHEFSSPNHYAERVLSTSGRSPPVRAISIAEHRSRASNNLVWCGDMLRRDIRRRLTC